jgi:RNA 2',3'-cyclic 3'-phosphodiesterase
MKASRKSRLFVAVPLENDFKEMLVAFQNQNSKVCGARWVPLANLHVTLCFIGETDTANIPEIIGCLQKVATKTGHFLLDFQDICLFPPGRNSRMIWARFHSSPQFNELVANTESALQRFLENSKEHTEIMPHVTIARLKRPIRDDELRHLEMYAVKKNIVSSCELWESSLMPQGAVYQCINAIPFVPR